MNRRTTKDYLQLIGLRIKEYRVNMELTQADIEHKTGVSVRSISRLEQGNSVQMETLVKVLMALNLSENLELLIPDQRKRPSYYLTPKPRERVRKKTKKKTFTWGDAK